MGGSFSMAPHGLVVRKATSLELRHVRTESGCGEFNAEVDQRCDEQDHPDPAQHANLLLIRRYPTAVEDELRPDECHQADDCWYDDIDMRHLPLLARTSQRCLHDKRPATRGRNRAAAPGALQVAGSGLD